MSHSNNRRIARVSRRSAAATPWQPSPIADTLVRMAQGFRLLRRAAALPPGQSPFHIKGQFYIQAMRALRRLDKPLDALLPDDLGTFCNQECLASQWYDVLPFPRLAMIEAEARGARDVREHEETGAAHGVRLGRVVITIDRAR